LTKSVPSSPTTHKVAFRLEYPMRFTGEGRPACESTSCRRGQISSRVLFGKERGKSSSHPHPEQYWVQPPTHPSRLFSAARTEQSIPNGGHPSSSQWSLEASSIWGSSSKRQNFSIHPNFAVEGQLLRRLADRRFVIILRLRVPLLRSIPYSLSSPFFDQLHAHRQDCVVNGKFEGSSKIVPTPSRCTPNTALSYGIVPD
jgi:hypothetical protein